MNEREEFCQRIDCQNLVQWTIIRGGMKVQLCDGCLEYSVGRITIEVLEQEIFFGLFLRP